MTKLVLLDMDGVLFTRVKLSNNKKNNIKYDFIFKGHIYYIREGASEFIYRLNELYDICIFTSISKYNTIKILNKITNIKFKHIFTREYTKLDPDYGKNPLIKSYDTIKLINDIINCPLLNTDRKYTLDNTIIIDDSYLKIRFNYPKNVIIYNHGSDMYTDEFVHIGSYEEILYYIQ